MSQILKEALNAGRSYLIKKNIQSAMLDAELLCMKATGLTRTQLYTQGNERLDGVSMSRFCRLLRLRGKSVPIAYLLHKKEFMGLEFYVNRNVLIPRPDTESLVERAANLIRDRGYKRVLEIGTGSGCIAVALAKACPNINITATDISAPALAVARRNARIHNTRIRFLLSDLFSGLSQETLYGLIISNPPYIAPNDPLLSPEVQRYEPRSALYAGEAGLDIYRRLIPHATARLVTGGALIVEIGANQGIAVRSMFEEHMFQHVQIEPDLAGRERTVTGSL